jgi:RNA polymerase sigma-70 factor (ECF subfamily)
VTEISELPDGASQLSMADRIVNRLELERALGLLPRQQREVIVLRYLIGMSVKEAAHVLEIPEGTIKSATNRALAALRNTLEDIYQEVHIHVD